MLITSTIPAYAEVIWDSSPDQPINKPWTVSFNQSVDPLSVHKDSVYVMNELGDKITTTSTVRGDKITISPPPTNYTNGETYTLHITNLVRNTEGEQLKEPVRKKFTIVQAPKPYDVVTIHPDGSTTSTNSFTTFAEAVAHTNTGQAIVFKNKIIKMPIGIIVTKPTASSSLTNIYTNETFKSAYTYVTNDTELEYIDSTDAYVKVKAAGKIGFIKHENSTLIPSQAVKNRSYYATKNGVLMHYIYSNAANKFASYEAGIAPTFMTDGVPYYSWDSVNFYTMNGGKAGTAYQYFQFLPARSQTQYSAAEIDAYIVAMLKDLETRYPNHVTYKDASKKSKLVGLGQYLKKVEREKKVNALHILALAQHESAYGLSTRAQEFNNLFGIRVFDDRPDALYSKSIEANIDELINAYFNKNYIPPNAAYANGAVFGNKALGFNVNYASDPYWGGKAAGHMYRIDKALGGRDIANAYEIGLTTEPLNVRFDPSTDRVAAFRYNNTGMPVIITGPATPSPWISIISDSITYDELFVHGDYVKRIPIVQ